jgi:hypothetical protein
MTLPIYIVENESLSVSEFILRTVFLLETNNEPILLPLISEETIQQNEDADNYESMPPLISLENIQQNEDALDAWSAADQANYNNYDWSAPQQANDNSVSFDDESNDSNEEEYVTNPTNRLDWRDRYIRENFGLYNNFHDYIESMNMPYNEYFALHDNEN